MKRKLLGLLGGWLAAGALLPVAACASGPDAAALMGEAARAERRYRLDEAASLYSKAASAALEARECDALLGAAAGLKRCVLLGGGRDLLDAAALDLIPVMSRDAGCAGPALGQLALGVAGSGQDPVPALDWLDAAMESTRSEADRLYLRRVHGLVAAGPDRDYTPGRAPSSPMNPLSEYFDEAPPIQVDRGDQIVRGENAWRGPEDGSLTARVAQFSQNLYISFRVTDDDVQTGEPGTAGDAVIVSLELTPGRSASHRRSPFGDRPAVLMRVPAATTLQPQGIDGACTRCWTVVRVRDGGYDLLLCLPRDGIPGLALEPGDSYVFDLALEDRDADGETLLRAWGLTPDLTDVYLGARVTSIHKPNPPNN